MPQIHCQRRGMDYQGRSSSDTMASSHSQLSFSLSPIKSKPTTTLHSTFLPPNPPSVKLKTTTHHPPVPISIITCSSSSKKNSIRNPTLDRQVTKSNKIRFIQKLKTLLLSKPKHYIPLPILAKCRSYLALPKPRSLLSMIHRYPTIFQVFTLPSFNSLDHQLCVRLTPAAESLATIHSGISSNKLAIKLQKLLMLSSHKRLLLSKLVHLGPDLELPPNFRSRLCNSHPERFKTVDTSYGRALELVSWDPSLAVPLPMSSKPAPDLILDRPLKFKHLRLSKGVNLKRKHRDFLINFGELPEVNPYSPVGEDWPEPQSIEAEKRACGVVREVLGMTVEKRTLVDHLTHFRKEFGLSNRVRALLVRHPELFYVSLKGQRDSVFLVEVYDEKGRLLGKDDNELLAAKEKLMELVREGKKIRREIRMNGGEILISKSDQIDDYEEEEDDGFDNLFDEDDWEDYDVDNDDDEDLTLGDEANGNYWTIHGETEREGEGLAALEHW